MVNSNKSARLVLGTAQFGSAYGIANKTGQPGIAEVIRIVSTAWEHGIREFDTAQIYGNSEAVLGEALLHLNIQKRARLITKTLPTLDHLDKKVLHNNIYSSLKKLSCESLYGLFLHREDLLDQWSDGLGENLLELLSKGIIKNIGVSTYTPARALQALKTEGVTFVQCPANIFDKRFLIAGVVGVAKELGKTIYIRSVFLQGLLLLAQDEVPDNMEFACTTIKRFRELLKTVKLSEHEASLGYVREVYPDARVILGAETAEQITSNIRAWRCNMPHVFLHKLFSEFEDVEEKVINPSLW